MQIIFTGRDLTEAHIVAGMLRAEGIEAHVGGHYLQGAIGDLAPMDFARVLINGADAEYAEALIKEYNRGREPAPVAAPSTDSTVHGISLPLVGWLILCGLFLFLLSWAV